MKFEYDERECVALVCNGHLYINADRKFYPCDKITITF